MKSRFIAIFLAVILVILTLLFWRHSNKNTNAPISPEKVAIQSSNNANTILQTGNSNFIISSNSASPVSQSQLTNARIALLKHELETKNAPVNFYGRVIDQESNGVAGVHILMHVRQWSLDAMADPWGNKFPKFDRITDSNGNFSLENVNGDSLTFESIVKDGYRLSPKTLKGYGFGNVSNPFHSDPQNPVIIKM